MSVRRIQTTVNHSLGFLITGQRFGRVLASNRYRVADLDVLERFNVTNKVADLPSFQRIARSLFGRELAHLDDFVFGARPNELNLVAFFNLAVHHANVRDRSAVFVVVRIEHHRLQFFLGTSSWRFDAVNDRVEQVVDVQTRFCTHANARLRVHADDLLHLLSHFIGALVLQVDFVDHRHDVQIVFNRGIAGGYGLSFNALERIGQ